MFKRLGWDQMVLIDEVMHYFFLFCKYDMAVLAFLRFLQASGRESFSHLLFIIVMEAFILFSFS